ncbi:MAG: hypothetical protein RMI93_02445 [Caldimicrobium sp.]|nr:hypothetical protein [Caldimicrobium sp.]MDW8182452.1 hypothetical protein [Caldimicrobium sp.]
MSLAYPPKTERLIPLLKSYLFKNFDLTFDGDYEPFTEDTLELLSKRDQKREAFIYLERIILENYRQGCYSQKLLEIILSLGEPLPGYVFYLAERPKFDYPFFNLGERIYFYPLLFGDITSLYLTLWRECGLFNSYYKALTQGLDLDHIKKDLKIVKKLGFTRFTPKSQSDLKEIWELLMTPEGEVWQETINHKETFILVGKRPLSETNMLKGKIRVFGSEIFYHLLEETDTEDLINFLKRSNSTWGVVNSKNLREDPFQHLNPFLLAYASLIHADRAKAKFHFLDTFTLHVLADLFFEWEDLGKASELYEIARPYTLQPIELTLSKASIHYALGDLESAEKLLREKLCGCLREDPRVHYNLGVIYLDLGERSKAEYHLYKAYLLNKEEVLFRKRLMDYLWEENRIQEIEEILKDLSSPEIQDKIYLGKCAFLRGDYSKALEMLQEILSFEERDGYALYFLAWLYLYFGKDREASSILLKEAQDKLPSEVMMKLKEEFSLPL